MRVRRDMSSIPHRSAGETWQRIIDLVTGRGSEDVQQLKDAAGVMGSIITDEHPASRSIMVEGVGPQLRIYCRYGMKAVEEGSAVDPSPGIPRRGLDDARALRCREYGLGEGVSVGDIAAIKVFDVDEADRAEEEQQEAAAKSGKDLMVDWNFGGRQ